MPVMDGLTLLGHLLQRGAGLPVAVMTGHRITADLRERLQQYGIAATFTKPIDISFLADRCSSSARKEMSIGLVNVAAMPYCCSRSRRSAVVRGPVDRESGV